jgi:hypothetical protein
MPWCISAMTSHLGRSRDKPFWSRRVWLQNATVSIIGGPLLIGCGGSDAAGGLTGELSQGPLPDLVTMIDHHSGVNGTTRALDTTATNIAAAPSRNGATNAAISFSATNASATTDIPEHLFANNWALGLWLRCRHAHPATLLKMLATDRSTLSMIRCNDGSAISLHVPATSGNLSLYGPPLVWGKEGELTDGRWHHLLIQQRDGQFQSFIDGVLATTTATDTPPTIKKVSSIRWGDSTWQGDLETVQLHNGAFSDLNVPSLVYKWTEIRPNVEVDYVAFYPFDGNAENDLGARLNGVTHNVQATSDRFNETNSAYLFNGIDSFIEVPDSYSPPMVNDWAFGFWAKSNSQKVMTAIAITPGVISLEIIFNRIYALTVDVNGAPLAGMGTGVSGGFTDGEWHFVLLQQRGSEIELYVNGALQSVSEVRIPVLGDHSTFIFGKGYGHPSMSTSQWYGALDDIQLHERSFNSNEIQRLATVVFPPADGAGLLAFRDSLWMLGGWNSNKTPTTSNAVWKSSDGVRWSLVTRAPWEGRHTAGWVIFNDRIWIIGGDRNSGHYQRDVWSSPDGLRWDLVTEQVPWSDRITPTVLVFKERLWVIGGTTTGEPPGNGAAFNDIYSSADGVSWRLESAGAPWAPRGLILGNLVFAGRMWIAGGGQYDDGRTYLNDLWSSDDGVNWRCDLIEAPWSGRQYHSVCVHHGKLWVVAGGVGNQLGGTRDVWYSPDGHRWVELPNTPWVERHATSLASLKERLWLVGGSNRSLLNDVWSLDFV